jgi:hypothetical protein
VALPSSLNQLKDEQNQRKTMRENIAFWLKKERVATGFYGMPMAF